MAVYSEKEFSVRDIERLYSPGERTLTLQSSLVDPPAPYTAPASTQEPVVYEEEAPVPASPYVQLGTADVLAASDSARIPSQNTDFRMSYSPCGDGGNMGNVFSQTKETMNEGSGAEFDFGHDDKYATLHWNEDTEEYFWGAEGTKNSYVGKHLGKGGDLTVGKYNAGIGVESAYHLKGAEGNFWAGYQSFYDAMDPIDSIAIGHQAAFHASGGRGNVYVGAKSAYYTDDSGITTEVYTTPTYTLLYTMASGNYSNHCPIVAMDGKMWMLERNPADTLNSNLLKSSTDGITWTTEATQATANAAQGHTFFVEHEGVVYSNLYGWAGTIALLQTWDGAVFSTAFSYATYHPLSPGNNYLDSACSYNGILVAIADLTDGEDDYYERAAYWSVGGQVWTKVTNYGAGTDTYVAYLSPDRPGIGDYSTPANQLIEFKDELYWICSRWESSRWATKVYQFSPTRFSLISTFNPDETYAHPFWPVVVGDYVYVWEQELSSGGGLSGTTNFNIQLWRSSDMITWTKVKDFGDIGCVGDALWLNHEMFFTCMRLNLADRGHAFIYRVNLDDFSATIETDIDVGFVTPRVYLTYYNNDIYINAYTKVWKRTTTTWYNTIYDLAASFNSFFGYATGYGNSDGQGVSLFGAYADVGSPGLFNATAIGFRSMVSAENTIILGGTGDYACRVGIGRTSCSHTLDVFGDARFTEPVKITKATGAAPLDVTSTTVCTNLNAELWDGLHKASLLGLDGLADPNADRVLFWDDSEGAIKWLACGNSVAITTTTLDAIQDIRTTAGPSFDHLHLTVAVGTAPMVVTSTTKVDNLNAALLDGRAYTAFPQLVISATAAPGVNDDVDNYREGAIWIEQDANKCYICVDNANGAAVWQEVGGAGSVSFLDLSDVAEADYTGHGEQFVKVNAAETGLEFSASSVAAHNVLSVSHGDTAAGAAARGSIIIGNSTPKWAALPVGDSGQVLTTDGTDVFWDDPPAAAAHALLSVTHNDTTAAAVQRGDLIIGAGASPTWSRLAKGTAGYYLKAGANEPEWAALPTLHRAGDLVLNENFDGLSLGALHGQGSYEDWGTWAFDGDGGVNETCLVADLGGGDYCFRIWQATQASPRSKTATLNIASPVNGIAGALIKWKWRCSDVDKSGDGGFYLYDTINAAVCARLYWQASSSKIVTYNGSTVSAITGAVSDNTWYEIQVLYQRVETTGGYIMVWVDGVFKGSWSAYNTTSPRQFADQIRMNIGSVAHAGECTIECDNLQIWNLFRVRA